MRQEYFHYDSEHEEKALATHSSAWRIPGMGGAWWAAVCGVAQSQTRLKWLSSSSSSEHENFNMKLVYLIINWESYVFKEWDS